MSPPPPSVATAGPPERPHAPHRSPVDGSPGTWERAATAALGGTLLARGLRRRSFGGAAAALGGGWLLYRAITGRGRSARTFVPAPTWSSSGSDRTGSGPSDGATTVERAVTVRGDADELAGVWRDPERLALVAGHVLEVTAGDGDGDGVAEDGNVEGGADQSDEGRLRWTVRGPLGRVLSWETRVVEERPGELLRWESVAGAAVPSEGEVRFDPAPGDRGTEVTLRVRFDPPGGRLGDAAMGRFGVVPDALVGGALRRFRSLVETGEVPTLEGNPSARGRGDLL
ncbi:SRPBCC family protein [Halorarum salinum]|uniref:SRPBCC family protein n=1 Tax=Halorarum salinum TaxID=2743089 RepID=A0A7D5L8H1_9EURY|nr:SRPBCC family protein [Halobaculum salinum]QLG60766.1 SRPBCC family protein [Halobaculum salinum]